MLNLPLHGNCPDDSAKIITVATRMQNTITVATIALGTIIIATIVLSTIDIAILLFKSLLLQQHKNSLEILALSLQQ